MNTPDELLRRLDKLPNRVVSPSKYSELEHQIESGKNPVGVLLEITDLEQKAGRKFETLDYRNPKPYVPEIIGEKERKEKSLKSKILSAAVAELASEEIGITNPAISDKEFFVLLDKLRKLKK